jgi:hypothetical protein
MGLNPEMNGLNLRESGGLISITLRYPTPRRIRCLTGILERIAKEKEDAEDAAKWL